MQVLVLFLLVSLSSTYDYEDFKRIDSTSQLTTYIQASPLNALVFSTRNKRRCLAVHAVVSRP